MARKLRVQYPHARYHVFNRGLDRRALFLDSRDCEAFLEDLQASSEERAGVVHAYALMPNHYHMLVETPRGNLGEFMQSLQTRYAVFFNRRHRKSGHVFQGPYKAVLVGDDDYLLQLSRYIHLNPAHGHAAEGTSMDERIRALRGYEWSSYRAYVGLAKRLGWVQYDLLESQVQSRFGVAKGAYRKFVEMGLAETQAEWDAALRVQRLAVGSEEFMDAMRQRYRELSGGSGLVREDISLAPAHRYPPADWVLGEICRALRIDKSTLLRRRGGAPYRGLAAKMLVLHAGLTQRQAARLLGVGTGAAISIRIREVAGLLNDSAEWRRKASKVERALQGRSPP